MSTAIQVTGVSKRFRLYHEQYRSLKERVLHGFRVPYEEFWALRDVNLEIREGETFGLLGHNGSGKSTLLKCVAGILRPTEGEIRTRGRLAAMLELGTGFHPDLTGRENVYLSASILGLPDSHIDTIFDDIVAFAELEPFIDNQVKHYSSGMYVRLGFAVAIHMEPDVLLVDEVLSVGDEAFQAKCLGRIREFQDEGRTIVIVTHTIDTVPQICDRAAVLDHGGLVMTGIPGAAVRALRERLFGLTPVSGDVAGDAASTSQRVRIGSVDLVYPESDRRPYLHPGDPLDVTLSYAVDGGRDEPVDDAVFSIAVYDTEGLQIFGTSTEILDVEVPPLTRSGTVRFHIAGVPLLDGDYFVSIKITGSGGAVIHDWHPRQYHFEVMNPGRSVGLVELPTTAEVKTSAVHEEAV